MTWSGGRSSGRWRSTTAMSAMRRRPWASPAPPSTAGWNGMAFSRPSGAAGFALGAALRAMAISGLAFGMLLTVQRGLYATAVVLLLALLLVGFDLFRSTRAADRVLAQFVDGMTAEGYERPTTPPGLADLGAAIQAALDRLAATRAERQQRS